MRCGPLFDLRSQRITDLWWRTLLRLRLASNPKVKAVNAKLVQWHG